MLINYNTQILIFEINKNKKTSIIKIIKILNNQYYRRFLIKKKLLIRRKSINETRSIRYRILKTIKIFIVLIIKIKINKIFRFTCFSIKY